MTNIDMTISGNQRYLVMQKLSRGEIKVSFLPRLTVIVYRLSFTVYRLPFIVYRLPFTVYRLPLIVYRLSFTVNR
jgi:hypothetical protein